MRVGRWNAFWWVGANLAGAIGYLCLSSMTWPEPELRGQGIVSAGDPLIWSLFAFPVLVACFLVNLVWSGFALARMIPTQTWWPAQPLLSISLVWIVTLCIDRTMR